MDTDDDGLLSTTEFTNLLMGLGFGGDHGQTEVNTPVARSTKHEQLNDITVTLNIPNIPLNIFILNAF